MDSIQTSQIIDRLKTDIERLIPDAKAPDTALEMILNLIESYGFKIVPDTPAYQFAGEIGTIVNNLLPDDAQIDPTQLLNALYGSGWIVTKTVQ